MPTCPRQRYPDGCPISEGKEQEKEIWPFVKSRCSCWRLNAFAGLQLSDFSAGRFEMPKGGFSAALFVERQS
jgi:hypothetical protein